MPEMQLDAKYDWYDHLGWRELSISLTRFDCAAFICRVATVVIGYAGWLLDSLVEVVRLRTPDRLPAFADFVLHVTRSTTLTRMLLVVRRIGGGNEDTRD
jgi:hypothetical protein